MTDQTKEELLDAIVILKQEKQNLKITVAMLETDARRQENRANEFKAELDIKSARVKELEKMLIPFIEWGVTKANLIDHQVTFIRKPT